MLTIFLNIFRSRRKPILAMFNVGIYAIKKLATSQSKELHVDFSRFKLSQWLEPQYLPNESLEIDTRGFRIDLVFVVTKKDFAVLKFSLPKAIESIAPEMRGEIQLIVPNRDLVECESLFKDKKLNICITDEDTLIDEYDRKILEEKFADRYTWVLQQVLKVASVMKSKSEATLIVDADTILLTRRDWFNKSGQQLLMPSDEFNSDYYSFLSQFGICANPPQYTFITHHMLIQKKFLAKAFKELGISSIHELIDLLKSKTQNSSQSPVCIDYELYAQFMHNFYPHHISLEQWSNVGLSVSRISQICESRLRIALLRFFYHSVSFHSWS